jgi:hypothetical protein
VIVSECFRNYLLPLDAPKIAGSPELDAYEYVERHRQWAPFARAFADWATRFETGSPFHGVTSDGQVRPGLYELQPEAAPTAAMVDAARALLGTLDEPQRRVVRHPLNSRVWRAWMNPEFYLNRFGLRLDEIDEPVREAVLQLLRASLSDKGFTKVRHAMWTNAFLGDLTNKPRVFGEFSYNVNLFGEPSTTAPWGWSLYGHHVAISVLVVGEQMVVSPVFLGAEPNIIDEGPHRGVQLFRDQDQLALELLRGLPAGVREKVVLFADKLDAAIPEGRVVFGDELHLAGMFQDNRVIPPEGVPAAEFPEGSRAQLMDLAALFVDHLPDGPLHAQLSRIHAHLDGTWFCWIGGCGDEDPFYFRIQSPVFLAEYEHHAGIVLTNQKPAKFHTHTIVRTPNGNDYGAALIALATNEKPTLDEDEFVSAVDP